MSNADKRNLLAVLSAGHDRAGFTHQQFWSRVIVNSFLMELISRELRHELLSDLFAGRFN